MKIYAIKDKATGFGNIINCNNDFHASRIAHDTVNGLDDNLISKHPEDYDLYCLGELNTESGEIKPEQRFMNNMAELKNA